MRIDRRTLCLPGLGARGPGLKTPHPAARRKGRRVGQTSPGWASDSRACLARGRRAACPSAEDLRA
ncbi:hypothetical protein GMYAFLOJ_CDS0084 [Microbacterium phage phiMiGM15]